MHKNDLGMSFSFWEEEGYPKHMGNTEQLKSFGEGVHRENFIPWCACYLAQRRGAFSARSQ